MSSEHLRIWRYRIDPARRAEFIAAYSSDGAWTQLFNRVEGYVGTTLWQDATDEDVYYTADRWRSETDFETFQATLGSVYTEMDRQFEHLTREETFLGAMHAVE